MLGLIIINIILSSEEPVTMKECRADEQKPFRITKQIINNVTQKCDWLQIKS